MTPLAKCLARIAAHDAKAVELRAERRQIVQAMLAKGHTLESIGREVGRTKQTVRQWLRVTEGTSK